MKLISTIICICCALYFTTIWAADSDKAKLKEVYSQYKSLFDRGKYTTSLPYAKQALELGKAISGAKSKTTATLSHNYGINLLRAHKAKQASEVLSDTVALYKEVYGNQAPELISLYTDLGAARLKENYKSAWYKAHDQAFSIAKKVYGNDSADYGFLLVTLGHVEIVNQAPNGEQRMKRGYKILQNLDTPHPDMYLAEFYMGKLELGYRHYKDARTHLENALRLLKEDTGPDFEQSIRAFLVETLENLDESELATEHLLAIGRQQAEAGIANLKPLFIKKPEFPKSVFRSQTGTNITGNKGGMVVLEFDVDEKGYTRDIKVVLLDGPDAYAKPAIEAVEKFRFAPRFINGKPEMVRFVKYTFNFLIQ